MNLKGGIRMKDTNFGGNEEIVGYCISCSYPDFCIGSSDIRGGCSWAVVWSNTFAITFCQNASGACPSEKNNS